MRIAGVLRLTPLVMILFVAGCASHNKGKIEGSKWSSQAATIKGQAAPAGLLKLDFGADGSLVYTAGPQALTGKYSLGMSDYVTFNLDQPLGGMKQHIETIVINGNQLTMTDSDGTQVIFTKTN
jgi:outer membrane lipoprotein-sorting protein